MHVTGTYNHSSMPLSGGGFAARTVPRPELPALPAPPKLPARELKDLIKLSERALDSARKLGQGSEHKLEKTLELIGEMLNRITGREAQRVSAAPDREAAQLPVPDAEAGVQQATFSAEAVSFSLSGTIATRDGARLSFSLNLQYTHATLATESLRADSGRDGFAVSYAGTAAELTSTSFSFSLGANGAAPAPAGTGSLLLEQQSHQDD